MDKPNAVHQQDAVPSNGLTVLVDPNEPSIDIVFLHGFTGHPERTWTHKKGDVRFPNEDNDDGEDVEPPSKHRKLNLNLFQKSHHERVNSNSVMYWPRDLVPLTVPQARVLTYGYDTHVRHLFGPPRSKNTVYDIAWDCLVALEAERRIEPSRPVLFIAHSLGGIIVKELLRRSNACHISQPHFSGIFDSTIGIMFFGTPHSGADPLGLLQHVVVTLVKAAVGLTVDEQIVNSLLPSSERLRELRDEFSPMAHRQNWTIYSFQEQVGLSFLSGRKVVEDTSSYLNLSSIETTQHIGRDHREMCRFTGINDLEYKKVAAALQRMTKSVTIGSKREHVPLMTTEQRRHLMDSLKFDQIGARQTTMKSAHAKTCKWLLRKSEYKDWLDSAKQKEHHGFLWIKGKPGAGKSTMMKFALANYRKTTKGMIVISFFFHARGVTLEKSTVGMYRSLLVQILEQLPELQCVFESLGFASWNSGFLHQWSVELLKDLFEQVVQRLGNSSVVCFIDALDECEECQIRDMVTFFQHLAELSIAAQIRFQVCFSSRHYPHITINKGLGLVLETQDEHIQDVSNYIESELKIGNSSLAQQIKAAILEKASGVFMWVVLVVGILNKEHDSGRRHVLRQRLREIPSDLHELFRDILTRDTQNRKELLSCIQWLLFTKRILKPEELYFAILSGIDDENLQEWDAKDVETDIFKKFILDCSKGLAEITSFKDIPGVQFIHESVRDFLLKENGLKGLWSHIGGNIEGESHERLKQCCLKYMSISSVHLKVGDPLPKASSEEAKALRQSTDEALPFLQYAVKNFFYHADTAGEHGVDQQSFVQSFESADWINLNNLFEKHESRRHIPDTRLLYILAENNCSNLITLHPSNLAGFEDGAERYRKPIFAALVTNSGEAVRAFLEIQANSLPPSSPLHSLRKQYCRDGYRFPKVLRESTFSLSGGYSDLARSGQHIVLAFLLEIDGASFDTRDGNGKTPLSWAAVNGHQTLVQLLLEKGADLETKDQEGRTPLSWAVMAGYKAIVQLLLEKGADLETKDQEGRTPLSWAVMAGYKAMVQLLLEKGADLETKDQEGRTPLWWAAVKGHRTVVQLLLEKGADLETKDREGEAPLSLAVVGGHEIVVQLLLEKGVDLETKDQEGRTPLSWAVMAGDKAIVQLLLSKGARIETE